MAPKSRAGHTNDQGRYPRDSKALERSRPLHITRYARREWFLVFQAMAEAGGTHPRTDATGHVRQNESRGNITWHSLHRVFSSPLPRQLRIFLTVCFVHTCWIHVIRRCLIVIMTHNLWVIRMTNQYDSPISGTRGSSGFGSVRREQIESKTLLIVNAGDHCDLKMTS